MSQNRAVDGTLGSRNDPQFEIVGICHRCVHRNADLFTCKAFPKGIPSEILVGKVMHTKPYKGDHGIQFKDRHGQSTRVKFPEMPGQSP